MSLQTNASSENIFDAAKIFDSKRKTTRFDWSSKIKIRIQKTNATKQFLVEEIVGAMDLGTGGLRFLYKNPLERNTVILAFISSMENDQSVIGRVKYCRSHKGVYYKIGVQFVQRSDQTTYLGS